MMRKTDKNFGYARREGFTVVSLPYAGNDLQFVVLLPDEINGLRGLESKVSADVLACAKLEKRDVDLYLPKFKLEPPTITLAKQFEALGMKTRSISQKVAQTSTEWRRASRTITSTSRRFSTKRLSQWTKKEPKQPPRQPWR
jgi:Serine protease inhibitor